MPQPIFAQYDDTGRSILDPNLFPFKQPFILAQSAIPVILLSAAASITATGAITGLTALPYTPAGVVQVYCFAQAGLSAGVYYARFSSTTACQLYLDAAGTITPTGISVGTYSSGTTAAILRQIQLPAGCLGNNGALRVQDLWGYSNSANSKSLGWTLSTYSCVGTQTTTASWRRSAVLRNRNSLQIQSAGGGSSNFNEGTTTAPTTQQTVDTSVAQLINITATLTNTADFIVLESYSFEVMPG